MNKVEFIKSLKDKLSLLPQNELDERINFYSEIIDDYIEDGLTEEDAVSKIGSVDEVVSEILKDTSLIRLAKEKFKPKRKLEPWVLVLLIAGFPLWLPLVSAVVSVIFTIYISFWSILISLWAIFVSLVVVGISLFIAGISSIFIQPASGALLVLAFSLICLGSSIYCYYGIKYLTKLLLKFGKGIILSIKKLFVRKETL